MYCSDAVSRSRVCTGRFALYALLVGVIYVVGLPLGVFVMLFKHRRTLFDNEPDAARASDSQFKSRVQETREKYGFLYESYGPSAWWWEVEELLRKLLLSAVIIVFEQGKSPLQVIRKHDVRRKQTRYHSNTDSCILTSCEFVAFIRIM